jgi:hypothetical protein
VCQKVRALADSPPDGIGQDKNLCNFHDEHESKPKPKSSKPQVACAMSCSNSPYLCCPHTHPRNPSGIYPRTAVPARAYVGEPCVNQGGPSPSPPLAQHAPITESSSPHWPILDPVSLRRWLERAKEGRGRKSKGQKPTSLVLRGGAPRRTTTTTARPRPLRRLLLLLCDARYPAPDRTAPHRTRHMASFCRSATRQGGQRRKRRCTV